MKHKHFLSNTYILGHLLFKRQFFKTEFPPKACAPVAKGLGGTGARCPRPKIWHPFYYENHGDFNLWWEIDPLYPLVCRRRLNVPSFCPLRIGLSCHMRSTFANDVFPYNRFSDMSAFYDFLFLFLNKSVLLGYVPKVFLERLGLFRTISGPIWINYGQILDQNCLTLIPIKNPIKIPHSYPLMEDGTWLLWKNPPPSSSPATF